jgi:hypothetical protein
MVYFDECPSIFLTRIRLDFVINPKAPRSEPEGSEKRPEFLMTDLV